MPHVPRNIQGGFSASDFWTQWNSVNPRMALFVLITPQSFWTSVDPVGLTSNTRDMTLPGQPGITFKSSPGITPTLAEQALGESSTLEFTGVYQAGIFEQEDVIAGKWNFATIEVFVACWDRSGPDKRNYGELVIAKCKTGEVKDYQTYFTAEARGYVGLLSNDVNKVTSRFCRVKEFGDAECGVNLAGTVTINGTAYDLQQSGLGGVIEPSPVYINEIGFDTSLFAGNTPSEPDFPDYFARFVNGKMTVTSGANAGVSREIAAAQEHGVFGYPFMNLNLKRKFPFELDGEVYTLTMGCNRSIEDCIIYDNIINRRAEDYVPGIEAANRVPPSS